jgi:hypothetical protein
MALGGDRVLRRDHRYQRGTRLNASAEPIGKDIAALDRDSVEEDLIVSKASAQIFMQGAGVPRGVAAAVADENRGHVELGQRLDPLVPRWPLGAPGGQQQSHQSGTFGASA